MSKSLKGDDNRCPPNQRGPLPRSLRRVTVRAQTPVSPRESPPHHPEKWKGHLERGHLHPEVVDNLQQAGRPRREKSERDRPVVGWHDDPLLKKTGGSDLEGHLLHPSGTAGHLPRQLDLGHQVSEAVGHRRSDTEIQGRLL